MSIVAFLALGTIVFNAFAEVYSDGKSDAVRNCMR